MNNNTEYEVIEIMDDSKIVIIKSDIPIKCGTFAKVYKKGNKLIDPDTGDDLGYAELYKGTGIVVQSNNSLTYIKCIKKRKFQPNDIFIKIPSIQYKYIFSNMFKENEVVEDVFKIDNNKYMESSFNHPQKGDMVSLISNY